MIEIQWVVDFHLIFETTFQLNFWNIILELRKSPASNAWAAIFPRAQVYKTEYNLAYFFFPI